MYLVDVYKRQDISYQTRPDDLNDDKKAWLDAHPDFDLDTCLLYTSRTERIL